MVKFFRQYFLRQIYFVFSCVSIIYLPDASAANTNAVITANTYVDAVITLTNCTTGFSLSGDPGTTTQASRAISCTVKTNSKRGYTIAVQAADNLLKGSADNNDTIPINVLQIRKASTGNFVPLSAASAITVYRQNRKTIQSGDTIAMDFQAKNIPFVNSDTYSVTLNVFATINPK